MQRDLSSLMYVVHVPDLNLRVKTDVYFVSYERSIFITDELLYSDITH